MAATKSAFRVSSAATFAFKLPELGTGLVGFALRLAQRFVDGGRSGQVIQRDVDADHGT